MTLNNAIAARNDAHARLAAATEATARARSTTDAAREEVERLESEERKTVERHARQLEERARSGKDGSGPVLVPSDRAFIAKRTAEATLAAALQAVARLQADEQAARAALASAETAVHKAAQAVRRAEARAKFERWRQHTLPACLAEQHELLAEWLNDRGSFTDRELLDITRLKGYFPPEALGLPMPLIGISMYDPDVFGGNSGLARGHIDDCAEALEKRLAELQARGATDQTSPTEQEAAP